jgi:hydroxyacyl-ACP dehydratase HTD2-like protein with hotdog domain
VRGPISPMHLMRWSAAIENWHRIHYDWRFATGHDGLPDLPVNGSWKQHILVQLVSQWIGEDGWLLKLGYRFDKPDLVGDTLTGYGTVTSVSDAGEHGLAEAELTLRNQRGELSTRGTCSVLLPRAGHAPLPYPVTGLLAGQAT